MKFTLEIELGNDAMQTEDDVARALKEVAKNIRNHGFDDATEGIFDLNGNKVGEWRLGR